LLDPALETAQLVRRDLQTTFYLVTFREAEPLIAAGTRRYYRLSRISG
jgi:hypothetical protein